MEKRVLFRQLEGFREIHREEMESPQKLITLLFAPFPTEGLGNKLESGDTHKVDVESAQKPTRWSLSQFL